MRPVNPRAYSKEPEKIYNKTDRLVLSEWNEILSLDAIVKVWHERKKFHNSQGHRIIHGPNFDGRCLVYTYEWDNANYSEEKRAWDAAIEKYQIEIAEWTENSKKRHNQLDIDEKILRAEHKLANLKAVKEGKPIPYPDK